MPGIRAVAKRVGRVPHSLRIWERQGRLPDHLLPSRNHRGHRVWTDEQVEAMVAWLGTQDMRPHKGLEAYREMRKAEKLQDSAP